MTKVNSPTVTPPSKIDMGFEREQHYPSIYWKARQQVIEELVISELVNEIREETGSKPLPQSWYMESRDLAAELRQMIIRTVENE